MAQSPCYYKHLDDKGEAFAKMLAAFHEAIFRAITNPGEQFLPAVWLGSYLPESDRKKLVRVLLDHHAQNMKKLEEAKKAPPRPVAVPRPNAGASPGAGCLASDPVTAFKGHARLLVCSMNLLMDPSWHVQIPHVPQAGEIIPWDLLKAGEPMASETLSRANKFAER